MIKNPVFFILSLLVLIILCTGFIGFSLYNINKEGAKCIQNPLAWAEEYHAYKYRCSCVDANKTISGLGLDLNWS